MSILYRFLPSSSHRLPLPLNALGTGLLVMLSNTVDCPMHQQRCCDFVTTRQESCLYNMTVNSIFTQTRTPRFFFLPRNTNSTHRGEILYSVGRFLTHYSLVTRARWPSWLPNHHVIWNQFVVLLFTARWLGREEQKRENESERARLGRSG